MSIELFANQLGPLASIVNALTNSATSCQVSNAQNFSVLSAGQQFRMAIQDTLISPVELVLVTVTSGTTFTIQRGIEGTTATAHIAGAPCAQVWTSYHCAASFPSGGQQTGASPYTFNGSQAVMEINPASPAASTVNIITGSLVPFRVYTVADGAGNAGTYNITLTPNSGPTPSGNIINANNGAVSFYWNGTSIRFV